MATFDDVYEPPTLDEVGDFQELTMLGGSRPCKDWFNGQAWVGC
ncbi:lasso RiPP family leader peptide-containing protein [Streptomyces iconiensis]|uniref:Lasso RiPP family leader peptide-containing protein n=1 Tax=Streptomyces iconiensis TaxID=1384038 RepID=A0ABT7A1M9_9ACTN|nr:lasso RiPP family leader peptide-containing protein [Streptomyces iconiensis]MDJ1135248.1 lasso RiPP family leader peptide-containing protein [Streptomyces iconiensis]